MVLSTTTEEASFLRQLQIHMQGQAVSPSLICMYKNGQPALDLVNNAVYEGD